MLKDSECFPTHHGVIGLLEFAEINIDSLQLQLLQLLQVIADSRG